MSCPEWELETCIDRKFPSLKLLAPMQFDIRVLMLFQQITVGGIGLVKSYSTKILQQLTPSTLTILGVIQIFAKLMPTTVILTRAIPRLLFLFSVCA